MSRHGRVRAVILLALAATLAFWGGAGWARADHCPPIDNPDPVPGQNTEYCHTPQPTAAPKTPKPTAKPTTAPTSAPRTAAPAPQGPTRTSSPATPAATPFEIEVPEEPAATTEIVVDPLDEATDFEAGEQAASASSWIFGFIVGLLVGGLLGRMSWGIRRRRRQQIFG